MEERETDFIKLVAWNP